MSLQSKALESWILTGPTATGKSAVGLELAMRLGAEILSLDSMAIYREMDIGTDKPSRVARQAVPHHLIDIVDRDEEFSVARYCEEAEKAIDDILARGKQVLFVGGSPLFLKALLRGLFTGPGADWEFRQAVLDELESAPSESLHQRLAQVDPLTAARLHPNDKRRLIRALEVYKLTGKPLGHQQLQFDEPISPDECKVFALQRPVEVQRERINRRVEAMFAEGLVDEVKRLVASGKPFGRTAAQAVGYRETCDYLEGTRTLADATEAVKARTRQFAKRQRTWFRSLSECRAVEIADDESPSTTADRIIAMATGIAK